MTHHLLKTEPDYFWSVASGDKNFELRENDREFAVGDTLNLAEYSPTTESFTGYVVAARVTYIINGPIWGLMQGYCIMGIQLYSDQAAAYEAGARLADDIF